MTRRRLWPCWVFAVFLVASAADAQQLAAGGRERVLVMPFDGASRDSRLYWLGEASAVLLGEDLSNRGVGVVTRDERARAVDELRLPARVSLSLATIIRVGESAGASDVVFGALTLDGDRLTVTVRSVRLDAGRMRPEVVDRGPLPELFATFDRIAGQLTGAAVLSDRPGSAHPPLPAFENYVKGLLSATPATAIKFLDASLAQFPTYDEARITLWHIHTAQGDHARALAVIAGVSDRPVIARRARFLAALSRLELKQYDAAVSALAGLAEQSPAAAISNNLGVALLRRGAPWPQGAASRYFREAAATDPLDPDYAFNLGYACWVEKNPQEAIRWLRETIRLDSGDPDAHFLLGVALSASGAPAEGEREQVLARRLSARYDEIVHRPAGPADVPASLERLREELDQRRHPLGEAVVIPADPRERQALAASYLDKGRRLFDAEQDREAIVELRRSLYVEPYQAAPLLMLGRIQLRANRAANAVEAATIALWCEDSAAGHIVLGEAYLLAKEEQLARIEALRALALDPASATARALLDKVGGKLPGVDPARAALRHPFAL